MHAILIDLRYDNWFSNLAIIMWMNVWVLSAWNKYYILYILHNNYTTQSATCVLHVRYICNTCVMFYVIHVSLKLHTLEDLLQLNICIYSYTFITFLADSCDYWCRPCCNCSALTHDICSGVIYVRMVCGFVYYVVGFPCVKSNDCVFAYFCTVIDDSELSYTFDLMRWTIRYLAGSLDV